MNEGLDYVLNVNGDDHQVTGAYHFESLLTVLRDQLGLGGTKQGCDQGRCGACTVKVDDEIVCSCLMLGASAQDSRIETVEGLSADGELTDVQSSFVEGAGIQCGFCTAGYMMAVTDLLERIPDPTTDEIKENLSGILCRCTGYSQIIESVQAAARGRNS